MAEKHDQARYQKGMEDVRACVASATPGVDDAQQARARARQALSDYQEQKAAALTAAAKRFMILQRVEFVIGALAVVQVGVWLLFLQAQASPLIATIAVCLLAYLIAAVLDSKAKAVREDIRYQIKAAKKAKLKNREGGKGVIVSFD